MSQEQTAVSDSTTIDKDDINARLMAVLESDQDTPAPSRGPVQLQAVRMSHI